MQQRLSLTVSLILILLCASWGLQYVAVKITNTGISPVLQGGLRSAFAAVLLFLWMLYKKEPFFEKDNSFWPGVCLGLLFSAEFILVYLGISYTNASRASIFLYTSPFFVAIGAQLFLPNEKIRLIQIIGLVCAFFGVVVAFSESLFGVSTEIILVGVESIGIGISKMLLGDLMILIGAVIWGASTVLIKASSLAKTRPSKTLLYQLVISGILLPLTSVILGEEGITKLSPLIITTFLYQVIWVAFITFLIWFWLIRHNPASLIASFTFLTPVFGVLAGVLLLGEAMTFQLVVALVLVGIGIYLVNRPAVR